MPFGFYRSPDPARPFRAGRGGALAARRGRAAEQRRGLCQGEAAVLPGYRAAEAQTLRDLREATGAMGE